LSVVSEQFDRVVLDDLEAAIVANEIGDEKSREFVVDVREFENGVYDLRRSRASAGAS
jgi:hypothetical protein